MPTFAGDTIARFRKGPDGKTPWEREQGRKWAGDSLEFGERSFVKEAKERASGAVKRDWEPMLIEARYLGQHAQTGAMVGFKLQQNVGIRQVGKISKECRGTCDQQLCWNPEVDVESQPGAAEGRAKKTRETRASQAQRRNSTRRSTRETSQI